MPAALASLALLLPVAAHAHGGFHESTDIGQLPAPGGDPTIVTNYGLLTPAEGDDWAWICEEVVGAAGSTAELENDGRWFLGSFDGLRTSDDLCDWPLHEGPLTGLYITDLQADPVVDGRVWATTATGDADNALWRSDDNGDSWTADATFEEGSTLRGMVQAPTGLPLWVAGWLEQPAPDDPTPMVWISTDGDSWQTVSLPADDVYSVSALGYADGAAWLRLAGAQDDALVRVEADGSVREVRRLDDVITAFDQGPDDGTVYVGGKDLGLFWSTDGGQTWGGPDDAPQPGCLRTRGDERFICGHNWSDGASVLRTDLQGGDPADWTWEPLVWFGDVRGPLSCPAGSDVAVTCEPLWEVAAPEAGFDQARSDDTGVDDTGGAPIDGDTGCCKGGAAGVLLLPGLLGWLRRRR